MKRLVLGFAALAAVVCCAKDVTIDLDCNAAKRAFFSHGGIPIGYVDNPKAGDEAAVLACRRAGAWMFHTSVCDDATLAFLSKYGIRIVLVLDGDLKSMIATLTRLLEHLAHRTATKRLTDLALQHVHTLEERAEDGIGHDTTYGW